MGWGPDCPACGQSAEWTEGEIQEAVYAPKTYCCSKCFAFYFLSVEEVEQYQQAAQQLLNETSTPRREETEEDWNRARHEWENPPEE